MDIVQLLSSKIVHFDDKRMKLCQFTIIPKTIILWYGASQNSFIVMGTAHALKILNMETRLKIKPSKNAIFKVVLRSKKSFPFFFRFWKRVRLTPNW